MLTIINATSWLFPDFTEAAKELPCPLVRFDILLTSSVPLTSEGKDWEEKLNNLRINHNVKTGFLTISSTIEEVLAFCLTEKTTQKKYNWNRIFILYAQYPHENSPY